MSGVVQIRQAGWDVAGPTNGYGCGKAPAYGVGGGAVDRVRRGRRSARSVKSRQGEVRWSCYAG
ncbi:hypothetical protein TPA0907_38780 [Micromonospora humidisoli]|nr:hypothetical protein TPA0907_38780 [Micromonospora sp. AKA109]